MIQHPQITEKATQMFARFARFEYAMKRVGLSLPDDKKAGPEHRMKPNWNGLKARPEIAACWDELRVDERVRYLIDRPALTYLSSNQIYGYGVSPPSPNNISSLVDAVLRVRNNLFHGDKQAVGAERDDRLLNACLAVLDTLLQAYPALKDDYEHPL